MPERHLIVIDGLDGSGKATQTALLAEYFQSKGIPVRQVTFPDYNSRSSELVKMYLNGEISNNPEDINAYGAAGFYASDRYISYLTDWGKDYQRGTLILCDRYVSSNAIHQMVKLQEKDWDSFLDWLQDYEYDKLGLPRPEQILYLDMHPDVSQKLLSARYQGDNSKKDIHESNLNYLLNCRKAALYAAEKLGWTVIPCSDSQQPYTIETISEQIKRIIGK